ncbi:MAG: GAF domain-containing protein [Anaerolineales bacterium]
MGTIDTYMSDLQATLDRLPRDRVEHVVHLLHEARLSRRHVFILGNGGSASTASHFVCDLAKNTRRAGWPGFRVIGLTDNVAILTAYANDDGFERVFAEQLIGLMQSGDVVIAISTSGNSPNVLEAVEAANLRGATTIGFTGFSGGRLASLVQWNVHVESDCVEHVEDVHLMLEHMICKALRDEAEQLGRSSDAVLPEAVPAVLDGLGTDGKWRRTLSALRQGLYEGKDLSNLLQEALLLTVENVGAQSGSLMVLDEAGNLVEGAVAYAGEVRPPAPHQLADTLRRGLAGWVFRNGNPALVEDTQRDPRWLASEWDALNAPRSAISVPLIGGERVIGVLTLVNPDTRRFTERDLALLSALAGGISLSAGAPPIPPRAEGVKQRSELRAAPAQGAGAAWPRMTEVSEAEGEP